MYRLLVILPVDMYYSILFIGIGSHFCWRSMLTSNLLKRKTILPFRDVETLLKDSTYQIAVRYLRKHLYRQEQNVPVSVVSMYY